MTLSFIGGTQRFYSGDRKFLWKSAGTGWQTAFNSHIEESGLDLILGSSPSGFWENIPAARQRTGWRATTWKQEDQSEATVRVGAEV